MTAKSDVWLDGGIVWAAPKGSLAEAASRDLTEQALALAAETGNWRILFDFRRSKLTHDVLALNRQAELLVQHNMPKLARTAMLCRHRSTDFQFWERVLSLRGLSAATFTDGEAAIGWLQVQEPNETEAPSAAGSASRPSVDVAAVKLQLRQFAEERKDALRSVVIAEFKELIECLNTQANNLGIDPPRATPGDADP